MIELLEPLNNKSPISTFLNSYGSGGLYHIAIEVEDLELKEKDIREKGGIVISKSEKGWNNMNVMFAMYFDGDLKHLVEYVVREKKVD